MVAVGIKDILRETPLEVTECERNETAEDSLFLAITLEFNSLVPSREPQLTLEQHKFELHRSTYTQLSFHSNYYSTVVG